MGNKTLLMIPGPVEFDPGVLQAMGEPTMSHVDPEFIEIFGDSLEKMRDVWFCPSGQPFVVAGSGTLAMAMAAANLVEPGERALVLSTGYFGDRYADLLKRYGSDVKVLRAPLGGVIDTDQVESELKGNSYKLMTFTHVDTSTAVRVNPEPLSKLGEKYGVLTLLDGVCSVGGEKIHQEEWGIDVVLTASQKAIGVPPGLALLVASPRAMSAWLSRKTPVNNYFVDWKNWLPIMEAYEARKPSYFATPAVNLISALNVSLKGILKEGMESRVERHWFLSEALKSAVKVIGLRQVPLSTEYNSFTLTAPFYPEGVNGGELLSKIREAGVTLAGGLHPDIKEKYFRIGHMGSIKPQDILATVVAIENGLYACGFDFELESGIDVARKMLDLR